MLIPFGAAGIGILGLAGWSAWVARKAEEMVPPDGRFVDIAGARLHVVELGPAHAEGPAIVMIHGLMGQLRNFSHSLAGRLAEDHRVLLVDRPGWGHSHLAGPRPDLAGQARMIAELIDRLGLVKPLVVGHSMGGAVALSLALDFPAVPHALALIAPLSQVAERLPPAFRGLMTPPGLRELLSWTIAVPAALARARRNAAEVFAPDPVPRDFATAGGGALAARPQAYQMGSFEVNMATRAMQTLVPRYGEITLPVSILFGRNDNVLDPARHGERTAREIVGARLTLIDGGHMLPVTHAAQTEAWLRAVLAGR
ncbi:alpha/beta fold hydrolase [Sphingomonas sp. HT-1]|uniref:alpha/beta fold hydrolase n=1 Tax=unclassified Sphingomonas TaxID=196159 RepID=UPI0002E80ABC|nr:MULTISPECIES: alpha/beta hydrolase [unclassified Sphingomonas]KTF70431.1 lactone esterase [Sphingomonas sp. WG]